MNISGFCVVLMHVLRVWGVGIVLLHLSLVGVSQDATDIFDPPDDPPVIKAARAANKIIVDGILNSAEWGDDVTIGGDDFFRIEPKQGGEIGFETNVRIKFDNKFLYAGVFCRDTLGRKGVRVQDFRRDFRYGENDVFFMQLDPQNLRRYCVSFQATPLGTQRDVQIFDDSVIDADWDALWSVRTSIVDSGWTAEFAIPFKSLRYELPESGEQVAWGFTVSRLARRSYEQTVFPAVPQAFSPYRMTYAARLEGLEVPKPALNLRVNPYLLYDYEYTKPAGMPKESEGKLKVGGDVKWAINSHAVLDLTVNTDFAQTDVDRAVNNLTRFNVLFPERRQFFLENSGIYPTDGGSIYPYFSRTIGLSNSQFNATAVPIDAGLRFNDRNEKRTLSALYVHQRATEAQAAANFSLARYQRNFGDQSNFGAMITHRYDESTPDFISNHNATATADFFIRPNNRLTLQGLMSVSYDEGLDKFGNAGSLFAGYKRNDLYAGWVSKWVSSNYLPGMGFTFGQDIIRHNPGGYYIWRPKKENSWIRRADPGVFFNYYHNASDGGFQQADIYIFPIYQWFRDNSFVEVSFTPTWQRIDEVFAPLGITVSPGDYFYVRGRFRYNTDRSRKLSGNVGANFGRFYNGNLLTLDAGLRYSPTPHAALSVDYELNRARSLGVAEEDKDVHLVSGELRVAINPRIQASVFYQYNSLGMTGRLYARLSWEYQPLSFVYLVFNNTQRDLDTDRFSSSGVIMKVNWMKQF